MATKFIPHPIAEEHGDAAGPSELLPQHYRFGHVTVRFLGAAMPAVTLGLALAYVMS